MNKDNESVKNFIAICNSLSYDVALIIHCDIQYYFLLNGFNISDDFIEVYGIMANTAIENGVFTNAHNMVGNSLDSKLNELLNSAPKRVKYDKSARYMVYCRNGGK